MSVSLRRRQWPAYAYLLGLYLGDGHLYAVKRGVYRMRIALDTRYPGIIGEGVRALRPVLPENRVSVAESASNAVHLQCYSKTWPRLFPQHGPGRKHSRAIELVYWQRRITFELPEFLVRGLIHSDGCRFVANQRGPMRSYRYPRYAFSNRSSGILEIFCDHLDLLGIEWTASAPHCIQIAQRTAVAKMDRFIGPKC